METKETVRMPYVAGQFYEADPADLEADINAMIAEAEEIDELVRSEVRPRAVILPHAGYVYSGMTAVKTVARTHGHEYKNMVVIAPSHSYPFRGLALTSTDWYSTPLGKIKVDTEAVDKLLASGNRLFQHSNDAHNYEHALEVELPILQKFHPHFTMLPMICGTIEQDEARELVKSLKEFWNPDTLWVISSDFTHYGRSFRYMPFSDNIEQNLRKLDLGAVEKLENLDLNGFEKYVESTGATICGACPIKLLLAMIAESGEKVTPELVEYTTSGKKTGDFAHCVSYVGMCFV